MGTLQPITFPSPGFLGINKEGRQKILPPAWATEAQNAVIDEAGRTAARKGWTNETATPITANAPIEALSEYIQNDGTLMLVAGAGLKLYQSTDNGATFSDKTGSVTVTANNWQFQNFVSKVYAAQAAHPLVVKSTTGDFAAVAASSGSVPTTPSAILAAFGRLWAIDSNGQRLKYCALEDATLWDEADGGGEVALSRLWTQGTDTAVGLGAFGSTLVVFGKRHIFLYTDGRGSDRGLDPATMYIADTIEGQGCVARDSIQTIGEGDLAWLAQSGVRFISRVLQEQASPLEDATGNNQSYVVSSFVTGITQSKTRSLYSPEERFYLLTNPESDNTLMVDVAAQLEDGTRRITEWPGFSPTAMARRLSGDVLLGFAGVVGKYDGYWDNDDQTYRFVFRSAWLDQGENNDVLKIPKRLKVLAYSPSAMTVTLKWFFDFKRRLFFAQRTFTGAASDEYGNGEYGTAQYGGNLAQRTITVPMSGSGQFVMLGIECEVDGNPFAVQSMTMYQDYGRLASN